MKIVYYNAMRELGHKTFEEIAELLLQDKGFTSRRK